MKHPRQHPRARRAASEAAAQTVLGVRPVVVALLCVTSLPAWSLDWSEPWRIPYDPVAADETSDEFAWRLFVALMWPADPTTGAADPRGGLGSGAARASVWERWENSADVYRDDGADPGRWGADDLPGIASGNRFESAALRRLPHARHIVAGRMESLEDPLERAQRLVEIRMNRIAFDYIRKTGLYNLDGQIAAVASGLPVAFPSGAIEVKASWRPIAAIDRRRYHTLRVRLANGQIRLYGLTALNIAAKELPRWFWASFEHIDNAARVGAEGWRLPSRDRYACAGQGAEADCNRVPSGIGLTQTIWAHYRLRGTQTRYLDAAGMPQRLGNSELEAGLQETASCITCHARAALAVGGGNARRLEVESQRHGYVGLPDPAWFRAVDADGRRLDFRPLDFVWSLAQAKPRRDRGVGAATVLR